MRRLPQAHTSVMLFDRDESSFQALCYLQQDRFVAEVDRLFNGPARPALAYAAANASPLQLAAAERYMQALRHDASTAGVATCIAAAAAAAETAHATSAAVAFPTSSTSDSSSASLPQLAPADSALVALHLLRPDVIQRSGPILIGLFALLVRHICAAGCRISTSTNTAAASSVHAQQSVAAAPAVSGVVLTPSVMSAAALPSTQPSAQPPPLATARTGA